MKINKNIFVLIIFFLLINNLNAQNILIKLKINETIVTNIDIQNENQYLISLNPKLQGLDKNLQEKIATESLIKEIIKKNELAKYFDLNKQNPYLESFLKNYYINLGFSDPDTFEKHLDTYNLSIKLIKEKLNYELLWNQLIFDKYNQQVKINESLLLEQINNQIQNENLIEYNLSEIFFKLDKGEAEKDKIELIKQSIQEIGFENTANLYSISESSKVGGKIGWIDENNLSKNISNSLKNINSGEYSELIKINNNYLILYVNEKKISKKKIDKKLELQKLIEVKKNEQLNNFSKIYFDKVKINSNINEF
jgi:peptidyl-prolyl cis-trans isomerase SurA